MNDLDISQSHQIDDLCRTLGAHRRASAAARELLVLAAHALANGQYRVAGEFIDRAELGLRRVEAS